MEAGQRGGLQKVRSTIRTSAGHAPTIMPAHGDGTTASASAAPAGDEKKSKWADTVDDEDVKVAQDEGEEGDDEVPEMGERTLERSETDVGADGTKKVTIWKINDHGRKVKCVQTIKVERKAVRIPKTVLERRSWPKFGKCADQPPGYHGKGFTFSGESVTSLDIQEQFLDLKSKAQVMEETNVAAKNAFKSQQSGPVSAWRPSTRPTSAIPPTLEPSAQDGSRTTYSGGAAREWATQMGQTATPAATGVDAKPGSSLAALAEGGASSGRYVPPSMRNSDGSRMDRREVQERDDTTTVRVSNLSDDVTDQDLRDLFRRMGPIQRVYLAKDKETGASRGFAFINFYSRQHAQAAIDKLNGHGYDHLILSVSWATPSENKK